jgi:hypothetical protein
MFEINEHQGQLIMEIVKYCTRFINPGMSRCQWVNISSRPFLKGRYEGKTARP